MDDKTSYPRSQERKIAALGIAIVVLYVLDWLGIFSIGVKQVMDIPMRVMALALTDSRVWLVLGVVAAIVVGLKLRQQEK